MTTATRRYIFPVVAVGENIKRAREAKGLSQRELALELGISRVNVSAWERGAYTPRFKNLEPLARILGTTVGALVDGEGT